MPRQITLVLLANFSLTRKKNICYFIFLSLSWGHNIKPWQQILIYSPKSAAEKNIFIDLKLKSAQQQKQIMWISKPRFFFFRWSCWHSSRICFCLSSPQTFISCSSWMSGQTFPVLQGSSCLCVRVLQQGRLTGSLWHAGADNPSPLPRLFHFRTTFHDGRNPKSLGGLRDWWDESRSGPHQRKCLFESSVFCSGGSITLCRVSFSVCNNL